MDREAQHQTSATDGLASYVRALRRPLLTREGEIEYALRIERARAEVEHRRGEAPVAAELVGDALAGLTARGKPRRGVLRPNHELSADALTAAVEQLAHIRHDLEGAASAQAGPARVHSILARQRALLATLPLADELWERLHGAWVEVATAAATARSRRDRWAIRTRTGCTPAMILEDHAAYLAARRRLAAARDDLVDANLRLVVAVARRYRGSSMTMLDLIQEGNLGLIRAVDGFDPRRGYRFSTYATWWIRQSMGRALANKDRTIRIPVHRSDKLRRMSRLSDTMTRELGRSPTAAELAAVMQTTAHEIRTLRRDAPDVTSLNTPLGDGETTLEDVVSLTVDWDLDGRLTEAEARARVDGLLAQLNLRERQVMRDRFGLDGTALTLRECGQRWGVTHERVRQIEVEALVKLRRYINAPEVADLLTR